MPDPKSMARVQRLLNGDFRPDDLTGLFLFARDHCGGRQTVAEIGHFVAHHYERNKGIVTRATREWFAAAQYFIACNKPSVRLQGGLNPNRMPPSTKDYLKIAVNRTGAKMIQRQTGLRFKNAQSRMQRMVDQLKKNDDGTWALPSSLAKADQALIGCVTRFLVLTPVFPAERLCKEFISTLRSNGLITDSEACAGAKRIRTLVQLYAIAAMHHCVVDVGDGTTVQLEARPKAGAIDVEAQIPNAVLSAVLEVDEEMRIAAPIFSADLQPEVHCHPDLITKQVWDFEIEVSLGEQLSPLR